MCADLEGMPLLYNMYPWDSTRQIHCCYYNHPKCVTGSCRKYLNCTGINIDLSEQVDLRKKNLQLLYQNRLVLIVGNMPFL